MPRPMHAPAGRVVVAAVALALTAVGCTDEPAPSRPRVDTAELTPGSCFVEPPGGAPDGRVTEVLTVEVVPCDQPHDGEVYAVSELPQEQWPGEVAVLETARGDCEQQLQAALRGAGGDGVGFYPITPTERSWVDGDDRTVVCVAHGPAGTVSGRLLPEG